MVALACKEMRFISFTLWWRILPLHFANTYTLTTILAIEEAYPSSVGLHKKLK
jgi:hypothetical protein